MTVKDQTNENKNDRQINEVDNKKDVWQTEWL